MLKVTIADTSKENLSKTVEVADFILVYKDKAGITITGSAVGIDEIELIGGVMAKLTKAQLSIATAWAEELRKHKCNVSPTGRVVPNTCNPTSVPNMMRAEAAGLESGRALERLAAKCAVSPSTIIQDAMKLELMTDYAKLGDVVIANAKQQMSPDKEIGALAEQLYAEALARTATEIATNSPLGKSLQKLMASLKLSEVTQKSK